jgi:hypothetical protein
MEDIDRLIKNLERLIRKENIYKLITKAIRKNENKIIALVTRDQIFKDGIKVTGQKIRPKGKPYSIYSQGYTRIKKRLGLFQGHIDLSLTGDYLRGFKIEYVTDGIFVKNDNFMKGSFNLSDHLRGFYGEYEGFTEQNTNRVVDIIFDDVAEFMLQALGKGVTV